MQFSLETSFQRPRVGATPGDDGSPMAFVNNNHDDDDVDGDARQRCCSRDPCQEFSLFREFRCSLELEASVGGLVEIRIYWKSGGVPIYVP